MKKLFLVLVCSFSASTAYADFEKIRTITDPQLGPLRQAEALDMNVDLEYSRLSGKNVGGILMRVGYLHFREPYLLSIGPVAQLSTKFPASYGLQIEADHLWAGFWGQGALMVNANKRVVGSVAVGWSFFGIDAQINNEPDSLVFFAKLKIPLGVILLYLNN